MRRRDFLAATGAGVAGLAATSEAEARGKRPPNLLFIMTDQQRWDALSLAGNKVLETPNLDRLAREGVYFENAYSPCPVCAPARASILTGRTIGNSGVRTNPDAYVKEDSGVFSMKTFDEILAGRGYVSEYHGKWHVPIYRARCYRNVEYTVKGQGRYRLRHFERYHELLDRNVPDREPRPGEQRSRFFRRPYRMDPLDRLYGRAPGDVPKDRKGKPVRLTQPDSHGRLDVPAEWSMTAYQARCVIDAMKRAKAEDEDGDGDKPFNITCSINFPHAPMLPTAPYYGMYPARDMTPPASIGDPMDNSPYRSANGRLRMPEYRDRDRIRYMISNYYGIVREIDDWVGKMLDTLRELGFEKNTLVVFTSDHGEMLGSHGMREKNIFYEESAHVPLIMRMPGAVKPGSVVSAPVSQVDLFATILDYLGAGRHESDGTSLRGLIEGGDAPERIAVSEWDWRGDTEANFMVRAGAWKFICPYTRKSKVTNALYNLEDDPHEMTNLVGANPDRARHARQAEEMKSRLVAWLESMGSPHLQGVKERPVVG